MPRGVSEAVYGHLAQSRSKAHRWNTFKLRNDPRFARNWRTSSALYLNRRACARAALDEKSQIQALTAPSGCLKKGRAHR